jgi:hypothetical protein
MRTLFFQNSVVLVGVGINAGMFVGVCVALGSLDCDGALTISGNQITNVLVTTTVAAGEPARATTGPWGQVNKNKQLKNIKLLTQIDKRLIDFVVPCKPRC